MVSRTALRPVTVYPMKLRKIPQTSDYLTMFALAFGALGVLSKVCEQLRFHFTFNAT